MSSELWREEKLWTEADHDKALDLGWTFEPIFGVLAFNQGTTAHKPMFAKGWSLMWTDDRTVGVISEKTCADYVARQSARGVQLYERAWLVYCKLSLEGKIAHDGEYYINEDTEGPYG